jgi:hypothetical protein
MQLHCSHIKTNEPQIFMAKPFTASIYGWTVTIQKKRLPTSWQKHSWQSQHALIFFYCWFLLFNTKTRFFTTPPAPSPIIYHTLMSAQLGSSSRSLWPLPHAPVLIALTQCAKSHSWGGKDWHRDWPCITRFFNFVYHITRYLIFDYLKHSHWHLRERMQSHCSHCRNLSL